MISTKESAELLGLIAAKTHYLFAVEDQELFDIVLQELTMSVNQFYESGGVTAQVTNAIDFASDPLELTHFEKKLLTDEYRLEFGLRPKHDDRIRPKPFEDKPWNDYNRRANVLDILQSHGWQVIGKGRSIKLSAPGKHRTKHSAAYNSLGEKELIVFSTNAEPFEPFKKYKPFTVYTLLEHGGDIRSAVKKLKEMGYGK